MSATIVKNKRALFDYDITERIEAGIALEGTEVKSLREGNVRLLDSYILVRAGEVWLFNCYIAHYRFGNRQNHDETRTRKLLLHKKEIEKLAFRLESKGMVAVPISLYWKQGRVKLQIGIGKGRKSHDKRELVEKRMVKRQLERAVKHADYSSS